MPPSPVPCPDGVQPEASHFHDDADQGGGPSVTGRHRRHRSPARPHALKVLYGDEEHAKIVHAAEIADLRPSSYVAAAALAMAEQVHSQAHAAADEANSAAERRRHATLTPHHDRELLAELIQARLALRRYGTNVNQIAAALNSGGAAPAWLERAVAGADRAVARLDAAAQTLTRRLT
jgi:hypothetical protein